MLSRSSTATATAAGQRTRALLVFTGLTLALTLANASGYLKFAPAEGAISRVFLVAALLDSCLLYVLVALAPAWLLHGAACLRERGKSGRAPRRSTAAIVYGAAVLFASALQIGLYADRRIYEIFGFHVNGFVVNLVVTPGGIESMGGETAAKQVVALVALGIAALELLALAAAVRIARSRPVVSRAPRPRGWVMALLAVALFATGERFTYAVSHLRGYAPVLDAASVVPFYQPLTIRGLARSFGFQPERRGAPRMRLAQGRVRYPLQPLQRVSHRPLNVVWLVAESWRADMLDPEIMPATWAFAQRALRFQNHYSGGNGTRMGMFSMFYGLYGSYWFAFLQDRTPPVLMDVFQHDGYQLSLYTSAAFTYPEFDKTIFAAVPSDRLHHLDEGAGWQRDRRNVGDLLDFLANRDPRRPFMTFMFFESAHARYYFPPESVIRRPYLEDLNYATMDLERDIGLIKNRYINACHHLDSQFGRVLAFLDRQGLLDSTIVVMTGDHGEAFLEKGRWGHGSDFSEEQTRVPLVLWIPGEAPRSVARTTSHIDLPATLLPRLGVANPPDDYTLGHDLLAPRGERDVVIADWNNLAVVGPDFKVVFPMGAAGFLQRRAATTRDDAPLEGGSRDAVLADHRDLWVEVLHELSRYVASG